MQAQGQRTAILSSLPLQILIYFENWFVLGFTAFNACAFVYKGSSYYYPKYMWPVEDQYLLFPCRGMNAQ